MAAEHEGCHVFNRNAELLSQEEAEARAVEHAGHAAHFVVRQFRKLAERPHHRIERIGDDDDERVRRVLGDAFAGRLHDFEIDAEEIVAAHARLARHAGGDDAHIGPGDAGIIIGALERGILAEHRRRFRDVERLALRQTLGDVEQDDVAQFFARGDMRQRAPDHAGTDEGDFRASHGGASLLEN